jgi:hypothetical protein
VKTVRIVHPQVGESVVPASAVAHWESSGWSPADEAPLANEAAQAEQADTAPATPVPPAEPEPAPAKEEAPARRRASKESE